jgi:endonuclease/exonuclease/phosphatase family metal-dependent hydrolase
VIAAHLGLLRRSRVDQAATLLHAFLELAPMPTILLGDFNEWRRHRRSALDVLEPYFGGQKPLASFPSRRPMLALDRILGWPQGLITGLAVHDTPLSRLASDHLPLKATVELAAIQRSLSKAA